MSVSSEFVSRHRLIDSDNAFANAEIRFIFNGVRCGIVVIVSAPIASGKTVEMLQTQIQIKFIGDERSQSNQSGRHLMEC